MLWEINNLKIIFRWFTNPSYWVWNINLYCQHTKAYDEWRQEWDIGPFSMIIHKPRKDV